MALEILISGEVIVRRPDREELLAIKQGTWKFDKLIEYAETMNQKILEARKSSSLPEFPDNESLNLLCTEILRGCFE